MVIIDCEQRSMVRRKVSYLAHDEKIATTFFFFPKAPGLFCRHCHKLSTLVDSISSIPIRVIYIFWRSTIPAEFSLIDISTQTGLAGPTPGWTKSRPMHHHPSPSHQTLRSHLRLGSRLRHHHPDSLALVASMPCVPRILLAR